jgi:hypothetical protein
MNIIITNKALALGEVKIFAIELVCSLNAISWDQVVLYLQQKSAYFPK